MGRYISKITINGSDPIYSKVGSTVTSFDEVLADSIYIENVRLKDSTGINQGVTIGGCASNALYFDIVNPDLDGYSGAKIEFWIKGEDTGNLPGGNATDDGGVVTIEDESAEISSTTTGTLGHDYFGDNTANISLSNGSDIPTEDTPDPEPADFPNYTPYTDWTEGEVDTDMETETTEETFDADTSEYDFSDNPNESEYSPVTPEEPEEEVLTGWTKIGVFNVQEAIFNADNTKVSLECYDNLALLTDSFEPYDRTSTVETYMAIINEELLQTYGFGFTSQLEVPDEEITWMDMTTYRESVGYIAGLCGGYVSCDEDGDIVVLGYQNDGIEVHSPDFVNGGFKSSNDNVSIVSSVTCDTKVGLGEDLITSGIGEGMRFENPFMTQEILDKYVYPKFVNLTYIVGSLQCQWSNQMRAGQLLKVFTVSEDEKRNGYIALLDETSDPDDIEELEAMIDNCGVPFFITNQTINIDNGTTFIDSLGLSVQEATTFVKSSEYRKIQRTYSVASTAKSTADTAEQLATEANEIAVATGQHFWNQDEVSYFLSTDTSVDSTKTYYTKDGDTYTPVASPTGNPSDLGYYEALGAGAYVTELDQETFKQTPVQKNSLWNSAGMFFRDGLKNLLSILAGVTKGIAIYDGEGNSSDNIVASFTGDGALIGKTNETHVELADDSLEMYDGNEGSFAHIGRPTDQEITDTFSVETATSTFTLSAIPSTIMSVVLDDVELSSSDYTISGATLTITSPSTVPSGSIVVASYITNANTTYYTMGRRKASEGVGLYSMAEGNRTTASGKYAHAEGNQSVASGGASHAEGSYTEALGTSSHTEGSHTKVYGAVSHAEGYYTTTYATRTHAEGEGTHAVGYRSHAEGHETISQGVSAHAQNIRTRTGGEACTSMGSHTCATNAQSVSEGWNNIASGINSHVMGAGNVASRSNQLVMGYYNEKSVSSDTKTDTFDGTGKKAIFIPSRAVASLNSVTIDGVAITAYTFNENVLTFDTPPASGSVIEIVYTYYESNDKALIIAHGNSTTGADVTSVDWSGNIETSGNIASNGKVTGTNLWGSQSADLFCSGQFGGLTIITGTKACKHSATVGQETFAVSFGTTFKYLPNVQLTSRNARGNYIGDLTVAGLTTTGFNISIYSRESASHTYNISWFAIGERA